MNRRTALTATALTAALLLASCASGPADPGATGTTGTTDAPDASAPLVVGLTYTPDVQFAPFYAGVEEGLFEAEGVTVELRHHGASESLFGALQAGDEDVVFAGGDEMVQARSQGVDIVNVATLYQEHPVVLIVPADSPIRTGADLAGHSVGIPGPYGETYFGLLALLRDAGLTEADVDVQHIGYTQQSALQTGAVDAVMGYVNNDAVQLSEAGFTVRSIPMVAAGDAPLIGIGLGASEATVEDRAADLAAVLRALRVVIDGPGQDPDTIVELSRPHVPGLADPTAAAKARATWAATLPLFTAGGAAVGAQHPEQWEAQSQFMLDAGLVATAVPAAQAYTTAIVDAVDAAAAG